MAVYIQAQTNAFANTRGKAKKEGTDQNVRRPLRGIQVKPNTYAVMRVKKANGEDVYLYDSSATEHPEEGETRIGKSTNYANFLIQRCGEQRAEKQMIIETFGEDYVYFFGERPRFLDVSGMLLNTADFQWKNEFWANYDKYLRGTKLVEQNARVYLYIDDAVIEGYIIGASTSSDANQPNMLPFSFQLFITHYQMIENVGSMYIPKSDRGDTAIEPISVLPDPTPAAIPASPVGINAFMAQNAKLANNATFGIQKALEKVRNTLYSVRTNVPWQGTGNVAQDITMYPPLTNQLVMTPAPTERPIYEMIDEYVLSSPQSLTGAALAASDAERKRLEGELAKRSPKALEEAVRAAFEEAGIDTGEPSAMRLLLGRGAFMAIQYMAPFGIARLKPQAKQGVTGTLELL